MTEYRLKRAAPLMGLHEQVATTVLREIEGARLITLSIPAGRDRDVLEPLKANLGCDLPRIGESARLLGDTAHLLRLGTDRLMILRLPGPAAAPDDIGGPPFEIAYRVDQSDYWALLELAGPLAVASLERSCRLDLHAEVFLPGHVARTPIEGVSTILLRLEADRFLTMAPRSYAHSLAHTLQTSLRYVSL